MMMFNIFYFLLIFIFILPTSKAAWTTYSTFTGYIPSYVYPMTLSAGDVIRGYLTWPSTIDLDIYLYKSGQNLLTDLTYVKKQFGATKKPQQLSYTIINQGTYYFRVDSYSFVSTAQPFQFDIYINGVLQKSVFNYILNVDHGRAVESFYISSSCSVRITYDGPAYPFQIYAPGVDIIYGNPIFSDTSNTVPKIYTGSLTTSGRYNLVIDHQLYTIYNLTSYNITIQTGGNGGDVTCTNICSNVSNSIGPLPTNPTICQCASGYQYIATSPPSCVANCGNGYAYNMTTSSCQPICGDGKVIGTQCDDANNIDGDGCNADCTFGNNNSCPATAAYINPNSGNCTSACPDGYYPNSATFRCQICQYTCATCSNSTTCNSCTTGSNRVLTGDQCIPAPGFFDNSSTNAIPCVSPCFTCTSNVTCLSCLTIFYMSGFECFPCSDRLSNCSQCNSNGTICTLCQADYLLNSTTNLCYEKCIDPNCTSCPTSINICQNCTVGFFSDGIRCINVCGDSLSVGTQQCDDGNNIDGDGCNADCTFGNNNSCPATAVYINPNTGNCTSTCPVGYFPNYTSYVCNACFYTCRSCSDPNNCNSCSASSNRILTGNQCLPAPGYFQNFTTDAVPCISPCATCNSSTICQTCVTGFYINASTCTTCSTSIANCIQCNSSVTCIKCELGFTVNITTYLCDQNPCLDIQCVLCPNSFSICTSCIAGYQPINGLCQPICGDFIKMDNQFCDDGNNNNDDGCSSTCTIETDFTCQLNLVTPAGSVCFYTGKISIDLVYINKVDGLNQVQMLFKLSPNNLSLINNMNQTTFMSMIQVQSPVPISSYDVFDNKDGTFSVTINYAADLHGQTINVLIDPSQAGLPAFSRTTPQTFALQVIPDDNQGAYFYDDSIYQYANIISTASTGISLIALLFFVISLISGKIVGIQMIAVVQISFFSLMSLSHVNPCFAALSSLKFINGYNKLSQNHMLDQLTPISPKAIFLFSRFTQNFNFTLAIIIIPLIVAFITFILSKTAFKENQKVNLIVKKAVGEYAFMGLLFGAYLVSIASALQIMYGKNKTQDMIGLVSIIECAVLLVMMIGYFVFLIFKPDFFGEFTEEFKKDKLSSKYYNFIIVERLIVGNGLIFLLSIKVQAALPIAIFLLLGILIAIKKPYKQNYHNHRVMLNMTIAITILGIYLAYRIIDSDTENKIKIFLYMPFVVCGLLVICVIYNSIAIIYSIYKMIKNRNTSLEITKLETQQMNTLNDESYNNYPNSPRTLKQPINTSPSPILQQDERKKIQKMKTDLHSIKNQLKMKLPSKNVDKLKNVQYTNFNQNVLSQMQETNQYDIL